MKTDQIYPYIALNYLGKIATFFFVFGLIAAGYSSADGTFTALTTSFCFDILDIRKTNRNEQQQVRIRRWVHLFISVLFLSVIIVFSNYHDEALIRTIFKIAGYTYGPILGLFAFGLFTKRTITKTKWIPIVSLITPLFVYTLTCFAPRILWGYQFGLELIIVNGLVMFGLLLAVSERRTNQF
jgi:Na+/proline symporter